MPQGNYKNKAYPLRIDEALMERIKDIAAKEDRTTNKQIEKILREWVEQYDASKNQELLVSQNTESKHKIS